jgi:hypothetical protein
MAGSTDEARKAVLDLIAEVAKVQTPSSNFNDETGVQTHKARAILMLSEAYAWLISPGNSHGGGSTAPK